MKRLIFALAAALPLAATAQAPSRLGYQGRLLKSDGTPASGVQTMGFALYDAPTGGTSLWSESQQVALTNGFYAVYLGDATPAGCTTSCTGIPASIFDGSERYLEITVGSTALTPRQRVDSVAYALMATNVKGGSVDATNITVAGTTIVNNSGQIVAPPAAHTHDAADIVSGILALARIPQGSGSGLDADLLDSLDSTAFAQKSELAAAGTINGSSSLVDWTQLKNVPPGFADGVDNDTQYSAGSGLALNGTTFSLLPGCGAGQSPVWNGAGWVCGSVAMDSGCPGPRIGGTCLLKYDNTQATNFQTAAQTCANLGGDLCTDSQEWPLAVGNWQNQYLQTTVLNSPHWSASFCDNDSGYWTGSNGGCGDDHSANSSYGYACCGGTSIIDPRVAVQTSPSGVKYVAIHDANDTYFEGAQAFCSALHADICTDSQTFLLRADGLLVNKTWTNSHSDNDATLYNAINGGTADDTHPSYQYGFACCPSLRPLDLSCPAARTQGVCAVAIHNVADSNFGTAAHACAAAGADLCSIAQSAVLRVANALTTPKVWTNSHSDNDSLNASVGVGTSMPDNPNLVNDLGGYACCLN